MKNVKISAKAAVHVDKEGNKHLYLCRDKDKYKKTLDSLLLPALEEDITHLIEDTEKNRKRIKSPNYKFYTPGGYYKDSVGHKVIVKEGDEIEIIFKIKRKKDA